MSFLKIIAVTFCALTIPTIAMAHGHLWYDRNAHVPQFGKLVIFPIVNTDGQYMIDKDVKSEIYKMNNNLNTRFIRKLKIKNTIPLGAMIDENKKLRVKDNTEYPKLLETYATEKERGAAVDSITAAPGYFVPHIKEIRLEPHISPAKTVTVQMKSWTEEEGGPNGDRKYDERSWTETHTIPEMRLLLYHMGVEHTMYNRKGEKILTYENQEHSYNYSLNNYRQKMFERLVKEFRDDYKGIQESYMNEQKNPKERSPISIGFKQIAVPQHVGNEEHLIKSVYFDLKNSALRYTKATVNYGGEDKGLPKYYVQGLISRYSLDRRWIEPSASTYNHIVSTQKSYWYDNKGGKHEMTTTKYETRIQDHHGYWEYYATVEGIFELVNANTGHTVFSGRYAETDDKTADAYLHLLKDFYTDVDKRLGLN